MNFEKDFLKVFWKMAIRAKHIIFLRILKYIRTMSMIIQVFLIMINKKRLNILEACLNCSTYKCLIVAFTILNMCYQ